MMLGRASYQAFSPVWPGMTEEFPVLLGAGKRLFSDTDKDKQNLKLIESESYASGIQKLVYDVVR